MREILFRGKNFCNEWVYGYLSRIEEEVLGDYIIVDWVKKTWYSISPETIGQFTGLLDKNGNKIFEGDILKDESYLTRIRDMSIVPNSEHINYYIVEWNSAKKVNGWQCRTIKTTRADNFGLGQTSHSSLYVYTDKSEKIGNIHDNPELLEDK